MPELLAYLKINGMGNMRNGRNGYENELNTDLTVNTLWENPDGATSLFNGQTVQLSENFANFRHIEYLAVMTSNSKIAISSGKVPVMTGVVLRCQLCYIYNYYRDVSFSGNTAGFTDCISIGQYGVALPKPPTINNIALVPWRIIGYK